MSRKWTRISIAVPIVVIAALLIGLFWLRAHRAPNTPRSGIYSSETYAFTFRYPTMYQVNEYAAETIALTDPTQSSNGDLVDINVDSSDDANMTFEAFVHDDAAHYCSTYPSVAARCTGVTRTSRYTTLSGQSGEIFYLVFESTTGEATAQREAGPFWAFDMTANAPHSRHAVLLIYPVHFADESSAAQAGAALARSVVDSITIDVK